MKALFILTSAINTKFGKYSPSERLAQTLASIDSIKEHAPGAEVCVLEMCGTPPTKEQLHGLYSKANYVLNYCADQAVIDIYNSTTNWDIVKNTTEVMVFADALSNLVENGTIANFDRVFKMSGRYCLTEKFDPAFYDTVADRIVVLERKGSQFPAQVTGGMQYQYMSRLWSWPANKTAEVEESYRTGFNAMAQRLHDGGYFDIEHMLYAYLPKDLVNEVPYVGLRGLLGPNGAAIED